MPVLFVAAWGGRTKNTYGIWYNELPLTKTPSLQVWLEFLLTTSLVPKLSFVGASKGDVMPGRTRGPASIREPNLDKSWLEYTYHHSLNTPVAPWIHAFSTFNHALNTRSIVPCFLSASGNLPCVGEEQEIRNERDVQFVTTGAFYRRESAEVCNPWGCIEQWLSRDLTRKEPEYWEGSWRLHLFKMMPYKSPRGFHFVKLLACELVLCTFTSSFSVGYY